MSRMMRISTSDTMMMSGARRFRTAKFIASTAERGLADRRRNRRRRRRWQFRRHKFARGATVITLVQQFDHEGFHLHRHRFHFSRKIAEADESWHRDGKTDRKSTRLN